MTTKIDREKREIGTYGSHHNQSYSQQPEQKIKKRKEKKKKENPIINKFYFNTYFSEKVFEKEY
jgi:hypothetical protein